MTVNPNDILRITAKMSLGGNDIQNVYHVQNGGMSTIPDATALAGLADWIDDAHVDINPSIASGVSYDTIEVFNVTQDYSLGDTTWTTLAIGGDGGASTVYAPQAAALVKFLTDVARSQGRKYIGGLTEDGVGTAGALEAIVLTRLLNYAGQLLSEPVLSGNQIKVGNWNPTLARFVQWGSALAADYLATQRRRRYGTGS